MGECSVPELDVISLENRALAYTLVLMDPFSSCGSPRETAYTVQCIVSYSFTELNCLCCTTVFGKAHGHWETHRQSSESQAKWGLPLYAVMLVP